MRSIPFLKVVLLVSATASAVATLAAQAPAPSSPSTPPLPVVHGLYVNRFAAQSARKMRNLIALADTTEINAFVIDMKDEFGLNYASHDPLVQRNAGHMGTIPDLAALLDTMRAHHIMPIARIVVFKDSVTARVNPQWTIRMANGQPWRDKKHMMWVNPYNRDLWEYDLRVAEECVKLGFAEVQFDYIRFPEPYKSLPPQVFPGAGDRTKPQVLGEFLTAARARIDKLGARTTADIFGLVTSVPGALEVGQQWETIASSVDVVLPMVYPSHYPHGSFGVERPNADPHHTIFEAISSAAKRDAKLGLTGEHVRPWLQAFTLGPPRYGPAELLAQKKAVYETGYHGWVLWNPGSQYDLFIPGLEKKHATTRVSAGSVAAPTHAPAR